MKALERIPFMVLVVFSGWLLAGCYTQVGTVRPEGPENSTQEQSTTDDGETYDNDSSQGENEYFDGNGYAEPRYGFNYYYPTFSMGFGYGYYEPWYWRQSLWYSYYDPFWCGTYYPAYYAGWYPPFGYYYPPYYSGGGYRYTYGGGRGGTTRTIGSTRGSGSVRGDGGTISRGGSSSGGTSLPTGVRSGSSVTGRAKEATPKVSTSRRKSDAGNRGGSRSGESVRGGSTRSGGSKEATPPRVRRETAPRPAPAPREDRGTQRGDAGQSGGRSYTPPPSPPAQSSPPPAQSAPPTNTGARGGNRR